MSLSIAVPLSSASSVPVVVVVSPLVWFTRFRRMPFALRTRPSRRFPVSVWVPVSPLPALWPCIPYTRQNTLSHPLVQTHPLHATFFSWPFTPCFPSTHLTHDPFHHIVPLDTVTLFSSRTWCAVSGAVHFRSCFPPFVVALLPPPSERFGSA